MKQKGEGGENAKKGGREGRGEEGRGEDFYNASLLEDANAVGDEDDFCLSCCCCFSFAFNSSIRLFISSGGY